MGIRTISLARLGLIATLAVGGALATFAPRDASAQVREAPASPLADALARGDYDLARSHALRHDDPESLLARALLADLDGSLSEALRFAHAAHDRASKTEDVIAAAAALARYQIALGSWDKAETTLRETLKKHPRGHEVRLELGLLLRAKGEHKEAEPILDHFTQLYNNGNLTSSESLVWLGRAMHALGNFDDANYAFQRAYDTDNKNTEALVYWGELFLEKYNVADAHRNFDEALKNNPNHPRALIGMAAIEMISSNQSDKVIPLLERAEAVAPEHPELWAIRAHLAIRDSDCDRARDAAARVIKTRPKEVEALSIVAICDYLDDDTAAFKRSSQAVMAINPKNADFWARVGDYGVMVHRYVEAMDLYRKALAIDEANPAALIGLGIGLSRINREDEGIEYLNKAFDVDPYNVRAYNMVELYEKTMPAYSFETYSDFKLRAHNREFDMINLFVGPVVEEAIQVFSKKYDFEPEPGLAVEIYPDATTFSVRSVGLPHISPHGICFGRVVTVRSPSDGNFNWRQVVWHELAHVYHLQLSKSRVPRWFTEGLAEYETNVWDASWQRHHDRELAIKVFAGDIPSVMELDFGFTHARSQVEILRAYHLASLAIHFIAETWGFDKIVAMLKGWAEHNDTEKVLALVLETDVPEFDRKFARWLERRLMNFDGQFLYDMEGLGSITEVERQLKLNGLDANAWAKLAVMQAMQGNIDASEESLSKALGINADDPEVNYAALLVRGQQGMAREVLEHGEKVLAASKDGYGLRLLLASASLQMNDTTGAQIHLLAATQLYSRGAHAWYQLGQLAKRLGDSALEERALKEVYMLDQHDPSLARARFELARSAGEEEQAWASLGRWIDVHPFSTEVHRHVVEMAPSRGAKAELARSWRALILLEPRERAQHYKDALEDFEELKMTEEIERFKAFAREEGVALGE